RQIFEKPDFTIKIDDKIFKLKSTYWITPLPEKNNKIIGRDEKKRVIAVTTSYGNGKIYAFGTFIGNTYGKDKKNDKNLKNFILYILKKHNCLPKIILKNGEGIIYRYGRSNDKTLLFIINPTNKKEAEFQIPENIFKESLIDIRENKKIKITKKDKKGNIKLKK
ncbi:MAG: hypothetical protein NZ891_08060, partial [bacterium]|nr:hypothetical protein [bacterium]MDW8164674.1 hypothetical protein [Candidatus Omnitrophota bacterium]